MQSNLVIIKMIFHFDRFIFIKQQMNIKLVFIAALLVCSAMSFSILQKLNNSPINANQSCTQDCCKSLPSRGSMTYHYYQKTGRFRGGSGQYAIDTHCYSGQGDGYNNPDKQCVQNTGPLPATTYKLGYCVNVMHQTVQRPCAFYLQPQKPSEMCGRSAFFVHGCNCCTPGDDTQPPSAGCSAGCIVMNYANRRKLRVGDILIVEHYEPKSLQQQQKENILDIIQDQNSS